MNLKFSFEKRFREERAVKYFCHVRKTYKRVLADDQELRSKQRTESSEVYRRHHCRIFRVKSLQANLINLIETFSTYMRELICRYERAMMLTFFSLRDEMETLDCSKPFVDFSCFVGWKQEIPFSCICWLQ